MTTDALPHHRRPLLETLGRVIGTLAAAAAVVGAVLLVYGSVLPYVVALGGPRLTDELGAENAPIILFWSLVLLGVGLASGYCVWTGRLRTVWVAALVGVGFGVLSLFSIGLYILPFSGLLLLAAVLLTVGARRDERPVAT